MVAHLFEPRKEIAHCIDTGDQALKPGYVQHILAIAGKAFAAFDCFVGTSVQQSERRKQCTTAGTAYVLCVRQCAVTVGRLQS